MTNLYMKLTSIFAYTLISLVAAHAVSSTEDSQQILSNAIAAWNMANTKDSSGNNNTLIVHGQVELGMELAGSELAASLDRGGDGKVAKLAGGWLDAGQGNGGMLNLTGDKFTALIRMRCPAASLWTTRGFFTKGGGHDHLVFNFFSYDFNQGAERMRVGCEIGIEGRTGLGAQVTVPIAEIGATNWHDIVARYNGHNLTLFVDGVAVDTKPVTGQLRQGNTESLAIGSGGPQDNSFIGFIDHAALWDRALSDDEITILSGGAAAVKRHSDIFSKYTPPINRPSTRDLVDACRALQQKFENDPNRPRYHFMPPENGYIMPGDPNGAIYWKGRYNLFYIFQRHQAVAPYDVNCWGHVSSLDLVHWVHHPTALDVAPNDPDRGIYSGAALVTKEGVPLIIYHGVGVGNCIALAQDDGLIGWKKSPDNPIVPNPKPGDKYYGIYTSWDPHAWLQGNTYYAIFGGHPGTGVRPALFKGPEMTQLQYVGPFFDNDSWSQPGEDISCPAFFPIGNKYMLLCISHMRGARYFIGRWTNEHFIGESYGRMNWPGGCMFAPEALALPDPKGRRIIWAWCMDERPMSVQIASGWSSVMTLPRVLSLDRDGVLHIKPVDELKELRYNPRSYKNLTISPDAKLPLKSVNGAQLELDLVMKGEGATEFGLKVRCTPDGAEQTAIIYDPKAKVLKIDLSKSTLDPAIRYRTWCLVKPKDLADANRRVFCQVAPLVLKPGEPLRLRVFLDHSVLEVYANNIQCLTQRIWPTRADALGVSLFSRGGKTEVKSLKAWDMMAASPD